jgi:hypothetical protein
MTLASVRAEANGTLIEPQSLPWSCGITFTEMLLVGNHTALQQHHHFLVCFDGMRMGHRACQKPQLPLRPTTTIHNNHRNKPGAPL